MSSVQYCVYVTHAGMVTFEDLERLRAQLEPGRIYSAADLYERYVKLMEADGQPVAHPTTLGHTLRRAAWRRVTVRKRTGPKVNGARKVKDTASWAVPGAPPWDEEDQRLRTVVRSMVERSGADYFPEDDIWDAYQSQVRVDGARDSCDRTEVMRRLTSLGWSVRRTENRRRLRYLHDAEAEKVRQERAKLDLWG